MNFSDLTDLQFIYEVSKWVQENKLTGKMYVNWCDGGVTGITTPNNWKKKTWFHFPGRIE